MENSICLPTISQVMIVFEKIFRNYHIAVVDSDNVFAVSYDANKRLWMRKQVSPVLVSPEITGYVIDRYVIIWKTHSREVLLLTEIALKNFCLMDSEEKSDFILRVTSSYGDFLYYYYRWNEEENSYKMRYYDIVKPENTKEPRKCEETEWTRMFIPKEEVSSVDRTIFFDYIKKYCV